MSVKCLLNFYGPRGIALEPETLPFSVTPFFNLLSEVAKTDAFASFLNELSAGCSGKEKGTCFELQTAAGAHAAVVTSQVKGFPLWFQSFPMQLVSTVQGACCIKPPNFFKRRNCGQGKEAQATKLGHRPAANIWASLAVWICIHNTATSVWPMSSSNQLCSFWSCWS